MTEFVTLMTACVLGFLHALEVDHMLAVTAFVSRRPTLATAARFGFRWGIGHSVAVLAAGGLLLATGLRWSDRYDSWGEAAVGMLLIGIGLWSLRSTRNLHIHPPAEHGVHLHTHRPPGHDGPGHHHQHQHQHHHPHERGHGITLVGLAHGLAGTSAVVALVPVTMVDRVSVGIGYLTAFGLGVTVAMTLFASISAVAMKQAAERSLALGRRITSSVGVAGILTGAFWIWRALSG
jgi:ABC-type nickel/cobalt efflux system permease component RcnA